MGNFWIPLLVLAITFIIGLPIALDLICAAVIYLMHCNMDIGNNEHIPSKPFEEVFPWQFECSHI